jgi:hypothetical protein
MYFMTFFSKGLKKAADAVFGQDWLIALAPEFPKAEDRTVALTRAYMNANAQGNEIAEWLEVRRNDSVGPFLFRDKPVGFSFFDRNKEICSDGVKLPMTNMSFAPAPAEKLEDGKYTVVRREAQPVRSGISFFLYRTNCPYNMIDYTAKVEQANLSLPQALGLLAQFEQARDPELLRDAALPEKYYATLATENAPSEKVAPAASPRVAGG